MRHVEGGKSVLKGGPIKQHMGHGQGPKGAMHACRESTGLCA